MYRSASEDHTSSSRLEEARHASSRVGSTKEALEDDEEALFDGCGEELDEYTRARLGGGGLDVDLRRAVNGAAPGKGGEAEGVSIVFLTTIGPLLCVRRASVLSVMASSNDC